MTLLIFDCDGTVVDSEYLHAQVETDLIRERFGIVSSVAEYNKQFCGAGLPKLCAWLEQETGKPLPSDFIDELSDRKTDLFPKQLKSIPHIADVLNEISHIPRCIASNGPLERTRSSLQSTGLAQWFEPHVFSAQMVARSKPAPDLFLYVAQQMKVSPQDCVVIEDSHHGVTAALAANMRVLGFAGGSHCYPEFKDRLQQAEVIFDDMRELPQLLQRMA